MRSKQWREFLFLTVLCIVSVTGHSEIAKCCSMGEILSGSETVDCVKMPTTAMELYSLNWFHQEPFRQRFPESDQAENLSTVPLADISSSDFIQQPACVEILHEETSGKNESKHPYMPILVHYRSGSDRNETDAASSVSMPEILKIRRCCPQGKIYVARRKRCVPLSEVYTMGNISDSKVFMSLLPATTSAMDFLQISRGPPKCKDTIYDYEVDPTNFAFENGTLYITVAAWKDASKEERISLSDTNSCLELSGDSTTSKNLVARVCQSLELCNQNTCVRKCCPEDEFLSMTEGCAKFDDSTSDLYFHQAVQQNFSRPPNYGVLVGSPCEYSMYALLPKDGELSLTSEGHIQTSDYHSLYKHHEYCMDIVLNSSDYVDTLYSFVCFGKPDYEDEPNIARYNFNTVLQSISCAALLITLLVYCCLPELQNLHGKTLMCHVVSLSLAYICLISVPWATPNSAFSDVSEEEGSVMCAFVGYTMLFAFLSAFCWLNVMCFDIWWTFGGLRGHSTRGRGHRKKFMLYCTYAWGVPIIVTFLAVLVDKTEILPLHIRPNVNLMNCWFPTLQGFNGEMLFFVGPILSQLISNIIFFILTAIHCSQVKDELQRINATDVSDSRSKRFNADRTKLVMNVKLFVVMGLSWVAEIASSLVNKYASDFKWREELFYLSDAFNCLQGLLIFLLFVMKARVYQAMRKRLGLNKRKEKRDPGSTALQDPYRIKNSTSNGSSNTLSTLVANSQCCELTPSSVLHRSMCA